jgi:hypothetical protein
MTRITACLVLFASVIALASCESFTSQKTYSMLPDQIFQTRGASEAMLGGYGIEDKAGIDSFERIGYLKDVPRPSQLIEMSDDELAAKNVHHRTSMSVQLKVISSAGAKAQAQIELVELSPSIQINSDLTRVFSLRIYDLHKRDIMAMINQDRELLDLLGSIDDIRIVTAIAVLDTKLIDDLVTEIDLTIKAQDTTGTVSGSAGLSSKAIRNATLSPGTVYAYQMSKVGWSEDGSQVLALKTDRPWVTDEFYVAAFTRAEIMAQHDADPTSPASP